MTTIHRPALLASLLWLSACGGSGDAGVPAGAPSDSLAADDPATTTSAPYASDAPATAAASTADEPAMAAADGTDRDGVSTSGNDRKKKKKGKKSSGGSPFALDSGDELLSWGGDELVYGGGDKVITNPDEPYVADPEVDRDVYSNGHDSGATLEQEAEPHDSGHTVTERPTRFDSTATPGFGAILTDEKHVDVFWKAKPDARGYNVYRDSKYYTTVFDNAYTDERVIDKDYYYEVVSFDHDNRYESIASGLTVSVWGTGTGYVPAGRRKSNFLDAYELEFSDEFNDYQLDTTKWNTAFLWGPDLVINNELQYYVDIAREPWFGWNPFVMDGQTLTIRATRTPAALRDKANQQPYLSGIITSYDRFKFTYGYVEARAKLPFGRGLWPAFWLLNHQYVEKKPEIDIMEFIGHDRDVVYHTYHYFDSQGTLRSSHSQPTTGIDFTNGFHTYGVEWSPGLLVYYVDGVEVHRISDPSVSSQDMYVIANLALGGWWAGSPDGSTPFPADYVLDYIRVYRKPDIYADAPLFDAAMPDEPTLPVEAGRTDVLPNKRPSFFDWPEGYPEGH